jgi:alkylation response protein AidB-like acyl-CoA dehydrogenase
MGFHGLIANEHSGFALGTARRALDELVALARSKRRGGGLETRTVADRETFQHDLGRAQATWHAARAYLFDVLGTAWRDVNAGQSLDPRQDELRAAMTWITEVSVEIVTTAFRYAGAGALAEPSPLQHCLRNIQGAAQHFQVSSGVYEERGRALLDLAAEANQGDHA